RGRGKRHPCRRRPASEPGGSGRSFPAGAECDARQGTAGPLECPGLARVGRGSTWWCVFRGAENGAIPIVLIRLALASVFSRDPGCVRGQLYVLQPAARLPEIGSREGGDVPVDSSASAFLTKFAGCDDFAADSWKFLL